MVLPKHTFGVKERLQMEPFSFEPLSLKGAFLIHPFFAADIRGGFVKDYSKEAFDKNGIDYDLKEVFYTISHKGVIRALHFQRVKQQPKLVRCVSGHVYDVIVDLRKNSPTFKEWLGFDLTGDNRLELLVPAGFAHGYLVIEDSIVSYKCAEKFYGEFDSGILWNDPDINVKWPLDQLHGSPIILADKDRNLMSFQQFLGVDF
jgi:dTDP-4-dehydrorhamnose 3,5-epimerase